MPCPACGLNGHYGHDYGDCDRWNEIRKKEEIESLKTELASEISQLKNDTERASVANRQREQDQKRSKKFARAFSWLQSRIFGI